jgi:uncharacterized protein YhaN
VILSRGYILGFGKLRDLSLDFHDGLNVVFAGNEGGKSTLQRFLIAMLYGQLRSDLKVQRRLDPWVEFYSPWQISEYGGILWCRLADGRQLEVHRSFGKEETRIEIRSSAGEDITGHYEQQRNGEVLFARSHFGMPKELFESVGVIRENRVAEIPGYETIRDRIANLAQSGDEELSIRRSLAELQEALDAIGTERAPTKPYKQALDRISALRAEQKDLEERRAQFQEWVEYRNRLAVEISGLERELSKAQATLLATRRRDMSARVHSLEEVDGHLGSLKTEIESLGARADFPSEKLDELNRLVGARESLARHLAEIRSDKEEALARLAQAESERRELEAYSSPAATQEADKVTEWFVSYLNVSLQKDGIQKTLVRLQEDIGSLERRLGETSAALRDPETDWQRLAREAAENEQFASQQCAALGEKISQEKSGLSAAVRRTRRRRALAAGLLLLGAGLAGTPIFFGTPSYDRLPFSPPAAIGACAGLVASAVILFFAASRSAEAVAETRKMVSRLEAEHKSIRDEGGAKRKKLNEVVAESGFENLDDFLTAAKRVEQERQKLSDLRSRLLEADRQRERLQTQSGELFQLLREALGQAGLVCSPGNLKYQIDIFRSNLRRFRELDARYNQCAQRAAALTSQDKELTEEFDRTGLLIHSILNQAGVDTPEQFREECRKRQKLLELLEKEASRRREFHRLSEGRTLAQWKDRLRELVEQPDPPGVDEGLERAAEGPEDVAPYLPYLPTIEEAEEKERRVMSRLSDAREEYARTVERVGQAFRDFRSPSEIEEDLATAESNFRRLETNRLALSAAIHMILNLSRQQQEVLAPQLNAAVEQRFLRLCGGRYSEVKIDPDFQVWIRESHTGRLHPAEHLSRGTQDQLYFALRFGILDLVCSESEPCPSLLDEPFAAYDRPRLSEAFRILEEESGRRQMILFTCREDVLEHAGRHSAHVIRLRDS